MIADSCVRFSCCQPYENDEINDFCALAYRIFCRGACPMRVSFISLGVFALIVILEICVAKLRLVLAAVLPLFRHSDNTHINCAHFHRHRQSRVSTNFFEINRLYSPIRNGFAIEIELAFCVSLKNIFSTSSFESIKSFIECCRIDIRRRI